MRVALWIVSIACSILLAVLPSHAQSRVALVIGNSAYRNAPPLPNTQNDATDIAASLQRLGFSVKTLHDGTFDDMRRALLQFGRDARGSDMAVVYFAGHGMEISGENWLIPVDAELRSDRDAENEAISLRSAMLQVANAASLGLVVLDSCRDNPFAAQMQRVSRPRAVERGLARVEPTDNVLVAYAAKDGTVASDGRGRNSPFTAALLNNLERAGIEIRFLLAAVRDEVLAATNRIQQPFVYGSLPQQPIYLKPQAQSEKIAAAPPPSLSQPLTEVERAWAAVQANPTIAAMEAFVRRFGDSFYADLARIRIEELKRTAVPPAQQAAIPPPAAGSPPSLHDRLLARLAALSLPADVAESRAKDYEADKDHKAIAVGLKAHRIWRQGEWATDDEAVAATLEKCQVFFGEPCVLVAVGDKVEPASGEPPVVRDMPRVRYDGLFEPEQIPGANSVLKRRTDVVSYRSGAGPKAAAYHPWGRLFIVRGIGQFEAEELVLKQCNDDPDRKGQNGPCFLYAVGDQVVLPQRSVKPLSQRRADQAQIQQAAAKQQRGDNSQPRQATTTTPAEAPSATAPTSVAAAFDGAMRGWMAHYGVSQASVAVMKDNRLIYATGYGGRGANERLDVWSLSKAITALCISTLVKDRRLRLDDPIGPLLAPLIKRFGPFADERIAGVTVAQLLSHRSGLPTHFVGNRFAPGLLEVLRQHRLRDATAAMLMPSIMKLHLAHAPGLNYEYSNVNYLLLGKIIESLTGQPYETACGDRVLAKAGIKQPALDPDWGRVTHSAGGWSLSGPEYLAFSRLFDAQQSPVLTAETRTFLNSTDGLWINDNKVVAYTLGVLVRPVAGAAANIFHGGAWHWDQLDSRGGPISENRGTWFVLAGNGIAWFASFDGVSSDTHPNAYRELDEAFWRASRSVSSWPTNDEFAAMGIGPVSSSDAPQPVSPNTRTQDASLGRNDQPASSLRATNSPSGRADSTAALYRLIVQTVDASVAPNGEWKGQVSGYKSKNNPKALVACLNWRETTPTHFSGRFSFRTGSSNRPPASLSDAVTEATKLCSNWCRDTCAVVDRNGENALQPPLDWPVAGPAKSSGELANTQPRPSGAPRKR